MLDHAQDPDMIVMVVMIMLAKLLPELRRRRAIANTVSLVLRLRCTYFHDCEGSLQQ